MVASFTAPDPRSVKALIEDSLAEPALGVGNFARAYPVADDRFKDYILRVVQPAHISDPRDLLTLRTKLSPPNQLLRDANFGQALLVNNPRYNPVVGFHLRRDGISLRQLRELAPDSIKRMEYFLHPLSNSESNPFIGVFTDLYRLAISGFTPDMTLGNVMFDPKVGSLSLIDQLGWKNEVRPSHDTAMATIERAQVLWKQALVAPPPEQADPATRAHYDALQASISKAMNEARTLIDRAGKDIPTSIAPLTFGKVRDVKAITLGMHRVKLLDALNALEPTAMGRA